MEQIYEKEKELLINSILEEIKKGHDSITFIYLIKTDEKLNTNQLVKDIKSFFAKKYNVNNIMLISTDLILININRIN